MSATVAQLAAAYGEFSVSRNAVFWLARTRQPVDGRRRAGDALFARTPDGLAALMDAARAARARPGSRTAPVQAGRLLTRPEAAAALGVDVEVISRLARAGRLASVRTPGGSRRYSAAQVASLARTPAA